MAGIYIHIPFCKQACHYCNFHFSTSHQQVPAMIDAIVQEIALQKNYLQQTVQTVYLGGGTPSLLSIEQLEQIFLALNTHFNILPNAEITLEANPDDITEELLIAWKTLGINRLSMGVQSFIEQDLQTMNRAHNATQALQSLQLATQYFDNITLDLIYGMPNSSHEQWLQNIQTAIQLGITHLSCYALTVEPKTALEKLIQKKVIADVDPTHQAQQFDLLCSTLAKAGFEHYEISNFAKPGFRSQHNSSYWKGKSYLGIGPSAHSFNGYSRQWNISNNALYIKSLQQQTLPFQIEQLTPAQQLNEYIMISLRTIEGLSLLHVQNNFGTNMAQQLQQQAQSYIHAMQMVQKDQHLILTQQGKFLADGIAADLFVDEQAAICSPKISQN